MENGSYINRNLKDSVSVIGKLYTGREGENYQAGGEAFCSGFAPDESRFAWSSGFRKVVLIPWNRYKNCLQTDDDQDGAGNTLSTERISIDCSFQVSSLAFGASTPETELISIRKAYWSRDFSKDLILATGHNNGRIRIWDPYSGKLLLELTDHRGTVSTLSFSPDGMLQLASGSEDGTIKIWDLSDDGNMYKTLSVVPKCPNKCLQWSHDSSVLCSVGVKQKAILWDMKEFKLKVRLTGHFNDIVSCSFSPDGAMVATASCDTRVIIWNVETGNQMKILHHVYPPPGIIYMAGLNEYFVRSVSFSPNGLQVATICSDGYLRFWDLLSERSDPEASIKGTENDMMLTCTYSPFGGAVAISYASGSVIFYLPPLKVTSLRQLCRISLRKKLGNNYNYKDLTIPRTLMHYLTYKHW